VSFPELPVLGEEALYEVGHALRVVLRTKVRAVDEAQVSASDSALLPRTSILRSSLLG
jgi:hypothetical protein